jgi:hypothetical protein
VKAFRLGSLVGVSFAFLGLAAACGPDNDILINPPANGTPPPAETPAPSDNQDNEPIVEEPAPEDDLSDADQLNSDDPPVDDAPSCEACPTPPSGASCCTTADDVTAIRAVEAGNCGVDMSSFGFPGCTQLAQPGVIDEACPPVEFPPGAPPMPGCCTEAGHCGAMETFMGFGCTSNPDASTWVACGG